MRNGLMILSLMLAMFLGNVAIAGPRCQSDCPTAVQPIRNTLKGVRGFLRKIAPIRRIGNRIRGFRNGERLCPSCTDAPTEKEV
jgi:hypothetical protein